MGEGDREREGGGEGGRDRRREGREGGRGGMEGGKGREGGREGGRERGKGRGELPTLWLCMRGEMSQEEAPSMTLLSGDSTNSDWGESGD